MYKQMTDEEYFALPHISQSKLKNLVDLNYAQFLTLPEPETSDAMRFGTIAHAVNLMEMSLDSIQVIEKPDGRTKAGKELKAQLEGNRQYLFTNEFEALKKMKANFEDSLEAVFMRDKAVMREHAGIVELNNTRWINGVPMKFKPDLIHSNTIIDYKTIGMHVTEDSIKKSMRSGRYSFQLACYLYLDSLLTGQMKKDAAIIWQETVEPYGVYVMPLHPESLEYGWTEFCKARDKYLEGINRPQLVSPNAKGFIQDPFFDYL